MTPSTFSFGVTLYPSNTNKTKKAELPQRWPRDAPDIWVHGKFLAVPEYAHSYFSRNFNVLLFRSILWMRVQNSEVRSFTRSWIIGGIQKNWAIPAYAHVLFSPKFFMGLVRMDPVKVSAKFAVSSFTRSWDNIAIAVLGWRCEPTILGKGRPYGVGDGTARKSVGEFL